MLSKLLEFAYSTGFLNITGPQAIMIVIALILLYLGIVKKYEPLLLVPISFGMLLVNLPLGGLMDPPMDGQVGGLFYFFRGAFTRVYIARGRFNRDYWWCRRPHSYLSYI